MKKIKDLLRSLVEETIVMNLDRQETDPMPTEELMKDELVKDFHDRFVGIINERQGKSTFARWQEKGDYKKGYLDALENLKLEIMEEE